MEQDELYDETKCGASLVTSTPTQPFVPNLAVIVAQEEGHDTFYLDGSKLTYEMYRELCSYNGFWVGRKEDIKARPYYNAFLHVVENLSGGKNRLMYEGEANEMAQIAAWKEKMGYDWRGEEEWRVPDGHIFVAAGDRSMLGHAKLVFQGCTPGLVHLIQVDMFC